MEMFLTPLSIVYIFISVFVLQECVLMLMTSKIISEYDQEIPQSQTAEKPHGTAKKSRPTITRHQEDKLSKATSSIFPIKMIAILEWT